LVEQRIRNARVGGSSPLPGTISSAKSPSLWVRALSRIPLWIWYPFASFLAFLAWRVFRYRRRVVVANLEASFPEWDDATRERVIRDYYRGFADVFVEAVRSLRLTPTQLGQRMKLLNPEVVREVSQGKPVMIMAAHQCNWEWLLLGFSTQLGMPVDAVYKPLVNPWAEREMFALRSRLGARPVQAQQLLADILQNRNVQRAIAIVADQEPVSSERKHWLKFLNRDSAFFLGAEEIARTVRYAAVFAQIRRVARGHYEVRFVPLVAAGEQLPPGEFTARYARMVEEQIRAAPADWPWSHKRWKLKKPLYGA
jgi:Kdo2-lipid IVA lauroyltransferase/acyltransferase